jgi:hypothetical protein
MAMGLEGKAYFESCLEVHCTKHRMLKTELFHSLWCSCLIKCLFER